MIKLLKSLWGLFQEESDERIQSPLESAAASGWRPHVVVHPNYWVESHFTRVDKLPPLLANVIDRGLTEGNIKDIQKEVAEDSLSLVRETLAIKLKESIGDAQGAWEVKHQNDEVLVQVKVFDDKNWPNAVIAWDNTKEIMDEYGIRFSDIEEEWDRSSLTGRIRIPTAQFRLEIESPLMWIVLHRNRKSTILWEHKLWVPK